MTLAEAKRLYCKAVTDGFAESEQGQEWWAEVRQEMQDVVAAKSDRAGAKVIRWWCDWDFGMSATKQARLIREEWARMKA